MMISPEEFQERFREVLNNDKHKIDVRRNVKWATSMMLPEHVKMLRDYYEEQGKAPRPQLEEWDLEAIQECIELAMKRNVEILIKRWIDGEFKYNQGLIQWIDFEKRIIELEDPFRSFELSMDEIVDVSVLE